VTDPAGLPVAERSQSRQIRAIVLIGLVTAISALRLFLLTRSMPATIAIVVVVVFLIFVLAWAVSTRRRRSADRAMAQDAGVLAAIVGTPLNVAAESRRPRRSHRLKPVVVTLFADRIVIRPARERVPSELRTIYNRDIATAEWTVVLPSSQRASLLRLSTSGPEIAVLFDVTGQREHLAQFRATLARVLAVPVTGEALPSGANRANRAVIAAVAVGALLGAGAIPLTTMVALGSGRVQVAGYHTYAGADHRSLIPGRPWGHACTPVVIELDPQTPATIREEAAAVVAEARAGGANLVLANENQSYDPARLRVSKKGGVVGVPISVQAHGVSNPGGRPLGFLASWHTKHDLDGRHDVLTHLEATLYTDALADDPVATRKALRVIVARTAGVDAGASTPGTGLAARLEQSTDAFSPADLHAVRVLSGCDK
jgi:hypothetical protein